MKKPVSPSRKKNKNTAADTAAQKKTSEKERYEFKPGNMLYPVPAVMVTCGSAEGESNIITVAWTGTVCSDPAMVYISVRSERYSYNLIHETKEFVINLTTEKLTRAMDFCGVRSGRDTDKWKETGLTKLPGKTVKCPVIKESPVNIECHVEKELKLGSHTMFLAKVTAVRADPGYIDEKGTFHLENTGLIAYSHGSYFSLGKKNGSFGFSVRKRKKNQRRKR